MNSHPRRFFCAFFAFLFLISAFSGCGSSNTESSVNNTSSMITPVPEGAVTVADPIPTPTPTPSVFDGLTDEQRNSISMLNYITVLSQKIHASKNSRIFLEKAYNSVINNFNPNSIDNRTLGELNTLLDTMEGYRMISVKRERLEYIYEQNQAIALRSAVPNPLGLLSAVRSFNLIDLVASVAYMAVDSVSSYNAASTEAKLEYLQDGWALDDEQAAFLHEQRKDTFSYMVRTVNENNLPGRLALTEEAVDELVKQENNSNIVSRIRALETASSKDTYEACGEYWLLLAKTYYENQDYQKCLDAIHTYENLGINVFRMDFDYAEILPLVIVAAGNTMKGDDYVKTAEYYVDAILHNTKESQWALRYFAAQTYIDLCSRTHNKDYLTKAYEITLNNINNLVATQRAQNELYLAPIIKQPTPENATKSQKEEIENYNKMLKESRKKELPPIDEPLMLNCELLKALLQEIKTTDQQIQEIDAILHENGKPLFLVEPIENSLNIALGYENTVSDAHINFNGKEITIPANYISDEGEIDLYQVASGQKPELLGAFQLNKVERKSDDDISTHISSWTIKLPKDFKYKDEMYVRLKIYPHPSSTSTVINLDFKAQKTWKGFDFIQVQ